MSIHYNITFSVYPDDFWAILAAYCSWICAFATWFVQFICIYVRKQSNFFSESAQCTSCNNKGCEKTKQIFFFGIFSWRQISSKILIRTRSLGALRARLSSGPPFFTIFTILDHFRPILTILDHFYHFSQFWTILDHLGPFWPCFTILDHFGPF